jgi:NADH-quinone oxidoreductase subunit L
MSVCAGWLNAFGAHYFADWTKNEVFVQAGVRDFKFSFSLAGVSIAAALVGAGAGGFYYILRRVGLRGLTERNRLARGGYVFLENKYYLDHLYTEGVVAGIKGPIAQASYWVNQNVIDGVVNGVATVSLAAARFVYQGIDQIVVDGAVNELGAGAEESGGILRLMQTGRVQQYAAVLFGAAGLVALALILFVT